MIRIDKARLGALTPLAKGGMAQVYLVGDPVPSVPGKLVFKELLPTVPAQSRPRMLDMMRQAVALRDAMTPAERQELDSVTVWPLALVQDRGADVGLLMRCLPDDFFIAAAGGRRVFEFQLLGASPDQARANGYDKSREPADKDLVRLTLMSHLAHAIEIIHRPRGSRRYVYGDMNLKNAAVATGPPRILLMDCDGVADQADPTRLQPNTPFFFPPELSSKQQLLHEQNQASDVYKLALCVIRGLATGRGATQLIEPASPLIRPGLLDRAGIDLLTGALSKDPGQRPTAEEIKDYLVGRVLDLADPPTLLSAELSTDVTLRGSEVFVRWTHRGARKVRIFSDVGNFSVDGLDPDAYPNGYPIKPPTACEIRVAVTGDDGLVDEGVAGRLHYFEVPPLQISLDPPPVVLADLPALRLPRAYAELPPYPRPAADAVALPDLSWPAVPPVDLSPPPVDLANAVPPRRLMKQLRHLMGHAYHAADAGIDATIRDVLRRGAQQMRADAEQAAGGVPSP